MRQGALTRLLCCSLAVAPAPAGAAPAAALSDQTGPASVADDAPEGGGVAGSSAADDEAAREAQAQLEGTVGGAPPPAMPTRMEPLAAGAWWSLFGAVALGSLAGVLGGLAETQEDKAVRLANEVDPLSGSRSQYDDVSGEYERALRRGRAYERTSWALLGISVAVLATSIALFSVRARRTRTQRRARLSPGRLEFRF